MKEDFYRSIIEKSPNAYACHRILCDQKGNPYDFECIEANHGFEKVTGLTVKEIMGKRITELLPWTSNEKTDWVKEFGKVALYGNTLEHKVYLESSQQTYRIRVFSPAKYYFVTIFSVIPGIGEHMGSSEIKYKLLVDSMAENLWVIDLNNQFTYISPSVRNTLGYTAEETIKLKPEQILTGDSYVQMMDLFRQALEEDRSEGRDPNRSWIIEAESYRKDGTRNWTKSTIRILRDENLEPIGFIGISQDVTEEKLAKEALQRSEEHLRLILDSTAEAIYGEDLEGNCTFINASCLRLLGYKNEKDILGRNLHQLAHYKYPDGRHFPREECPICHTITKGEGLHRDDIFFWRSDGSGFFAEVFAYPQFRGDKLVGAVITFFDITQRKTMEKELQESERIKDILLANLPGMAYKITYGPRLSLDYISDGCLALTGYDADVIMENINSCLRKPKDSLEFNEIVSRIQNRIAEALTTQAVYKDEYPIQTISGQTKWVLDQGKGIYSEEGDLIALEGLIIDISDRREKEEENLFLTYHDTLTGLYNRFYYQKAINALDRKENLPLSIIIGDINGLKLINDAFGHDMGDSLIMDSAKILRSCCREDDVVARIGGDEFCIILPRTDSTTAAKRIHMILKTCTKFNKKLSSKGYTVDIALGFATKTNPSEDLRHVIKQAEDNMYKHKLLERNSSRSMLVSSIKKTLFERTLETEEHTERLMSLARLLGNKLGLSQTDLDDLLLLATLHDIGEVSVEESILNKPCALTDAEWEEIKKHPETGYRIAMSCQEFKDIAEYILSHQERWDGKGYPQGLSGQEIPLLSRIIAVVDSYDAMTQPRPYRRALSQEEAIQEIKENMGTQFDPEIAQVFLDLIVDHQIL